MGPQVGKCGTLAYRSNCLSDFSLYSLFIYLFSKLMIHIYIYFHTKYRTYSHLLFKKECNVKRLLLLFHFLFIINT